MPMCLPLSGQPEPGPRYSAFQEVEMLPGMLGNSASNTNHHSNLKPHSNIIVSACQNIILLV